MVLFQKCSIFYPDQALVLNPLPPELLSSDQKFSLAFAQIFHINRIVSDVPVRDTRR